MREADAIAARIRSATFAGKRYTIEFPDTLDGGRDLGWCWYPSNGEAGSLEVRATLTGQALLDTLIHEMLHASLGPDATERQVRRVATELARVLWRAGYRVRKRA